ncbi:hypothetical protein [Pseudomonas fluorescens]|uniref:hypothetical protein n=1 Tax=Pseudomonas fluorescens TaxID=294 RepID=UPI00123FBDC5|nr:hypothetical protein [Pseudomonas fluorescens]VVP46801.1 hypothetical protein PS898_05110 [Pseudomonas fluorescens]
MGIVRQSVISPSSRSPTDVLPSRKRSGSGLPDHPPAVKSFRADIEQVGVEVVRPGYTPIAAVTVEALPRTGVLPTHPTVTTLERYRLKAPAILPAANAWGLRIIKGRIYADIGSGEIVQVRQSAQTGEYRATLASELNASGPELFFDPQSATWKLERVQPLDNRGTVIDIDIDALIHEVRNHSAKKHRVDTGLNDSFERKTANDAPLVARGLKQFAPQEAALIRSELRVVESIFADAAHFAGLNYTETAALYESFFGSEHSAVASQVAGSVARGLALSREYQGHWGEEKFLGVDTDTNSEAWMYKGDFHGRFFLNRKYMRQGDLSMSLGHEMLHTNRIDRFKAVGPNAADFFYLDANMRSLLGAEPQTIYDVAERGVSEVIMRGGLTVDYLNAFSDHHDSFLFRISDYLGIGDDLDLETAVKLFNANPLMRAQMAANNADSIIYAAKSMQVLHRAKIEYAWLDSLIDD